MNVLKPQTANSATRRPITPSAIIRTVTKPVGPYTPAIRAGDLLICSGQISIVDGTVVGDTIDAQVRQAMANLKSLLEANGASLNDVVKTTVFLVSMDDYDEMNTAYMDCFGDHRPTRSAIAVYQLPLGARVEIEAWAYLGQS